jgi:hypothetical protein
MTLQATPSMKSRRVMPLLMSVLFDLMEIFAGVRFADIVSTIPRMCKQYQGSA